MCIYYKGREDLTYNSEDHIFSASIGGKKKLPLGFVSDQFNNDISKLEQVVFRESLISIPRQFEGPGHRGKLGDRYAIKSKVLLSIDENSKTTSLGYMQKGKFTAIPFAELEVESGFNQFHLPVANKDDAMTAIAEFKSRLQALDKLKIRRINDERLSVGKIFFGIASDVEENFNCFIFKNPETAQDLTPQILLTHLEGLDFADREGRPGAHKSDVTQSVTLDSEHLRVYGKIAFNFFASLTGPIVPMEDRFDTIRNYVAGIEKMPLAQYILNGLDPLPELTARMTKLDHSVVLFATGKQLIARVVLYYLPVHVLIADNYTFKTPPSGMIVDWRNHREIGLGEFMNTRLSSQ